MNDNEDLRLQLLEDEEYINWLNTIHTQTLEELHM